MLKYLFSKAFAMFAFVALTAACTFGQAVNNAQIHGVITDPGGGAIIGAQVKVTQVDTGATRTTQSIAGGVYELPDLPVGPYVLEISANGFQLYMQKGIILQVGQDAQVNIPLQLGTVSEKMVVQADTAMVETRETAVSAVLDQRRIVDLPLDGRQVTDLVTLSGAATTPTNIPNNDLISTKNYGNGVGVSSVAISVAGGQVNGTNYLLDGGDNNDMFSDVNLPFPFPDAIQEFSVQTSTASARYGVHPGATVNIVTKSGTNDFHGDVFEFIRNNAVNAAPYFEQQGGIDSLKRNQFGGTLGGPILKNKLMFFAGYQGTIYDQASATNIAHVPTAAALAGDFSGLAACANEKLKAPFFNAADQLNPGFTFNQQALNLLALVPAPDSATDPCGTVHFAISNNYTENQGLGRVDWTVSSKQFLFVRYFISDYTNPPVYDGKNILTSTKAGELARSQSATIGHVYSISPTLVNSIHLTGTRLAIFRGSASNLPNFDTFGVNIPNPIAASLVASITGYFNVANGTATPGHFNRNVYQAADDMDWTKGRHAITFGVDLIHSRLNELSNQLTNGQFTFSGDVTGDGLADLLLGLPKTFNQGNPEAENWRQTYWGLYAQDSFKATRKLTLNVGIRWEPYFPAHDADHRGSLFSDSAYQSATISTVFPSAPPGLFFCGDSQTSCSYVNSHKADFSPRVGVAWDPRGKGRETVRAGYAIFYDNPEVFFFDRFADNAPFGSSISLNEPAGGFTNPYQGQTVPQFPTPFPNSTNATFFTNGVYINIPDNLKPTYTQTWNLSLERQVGANWLFSVSYLGNKTTHIWGGYAADAPVLTGPAVASTDPRCTKTTLLVSCTTNEAARQFLTLQNVMFTPVGQTKAVNAGTYFSSLSQAFDGSNSEYNGILFSANHRFSGHFTLLANYAYSHCISEYDFEGELASGGRLVAGTNAAGTGPDSLAEERGNCSFDRRQVANASLIATSPMFAGALARRFLGSWELSALGKYQTGSYFTILSAVDNSLTKIGNDRADAVSGVSTTSGTCPNGIRVGDPMCWFNTAAFTTNALGTFGDTGRNSVLGPSYFTINTAVSREFPIKERVRFDLRVEVFNLLNHPIFLNPGVAGESNLTANGNQVGKTNFGQITATLQDSQRIFQAAAKITF